MKRKRASIAHEVLLSLHRPRICLLIAAWPMDGGGGGGGGGKHFREGRKTRRKHLTNQNLGKTMAKTWGDDYHVKRLNLKLTVIFTQEQGMRRLQKVIWMDFRVYVILISEGGDHSIITSTHTQKKSNRNFQFNLYNTFICKYGNYEYTNTRQCWHIMSVIGLGRKMHKIQ
jgi:hypothetical protein